MTSEPAASESHDIDEPTHSVPAQRCHPLDEETRKREWDKLFDDYQAEFGAFTEEELAEARKAMYG